MTGVLDITGKAYESGNKVVEAADIVGPEDDLELQKAKQSLTGRGVLLRDLIVDGIIEPGENVLSIDYRGQRFEADLLQTGKIRWQGAQEEFCTPSAWATHCKRLVNPIKRSGCGWASVKYKGRKLDTWKSIWSRRHHPSSPFHSSASQLHEATDNTTPKTYPSSQLFKKMDACLSSTSESTAGLSSIQSSCTKLVEESVLPLSVEPLQSSAISVNGDESIETIKVSDKCITDMQDEALNLSLSATTHFRINVETNDALPTCLSLTTPSIMQSNHRQTSVDFASLRAIGQPWHPGQFVKCENFSTISKTQPFDVILSTNVLLLMDFHCHLTVTEVVGYLGGSWCPQTQNVHITQVFPCKCPLDDKATAATAEEQIRQDMEIAGCSLVGWYHSHPSFHPDPSLRDIECQLKHQLHMKGTGGIYLPCVGIILSPYDVEIENVESRYQAFCVMAYNDDPGQIGMPMRLMCSVHQSATLSEELLSEMNRLVNYYNGYPCRVRWTEQWSEQGGTYLDKLKGSLLSKLPKDQAESNSFLAYIEQLVIIK